MKSNKKNIFISEINEIISEIVRNKKTGPFGVYWISNEKGFLEDIYSGNAGIILFLLEYYIQFKNERVLELLNESSLGLLKFCQESPSNNYSFYTGRIGSAFTLITVWSIIEREDLIPETLELLKNADIFLRDEDLSCDLINGISGSIIGLLHIYHKTQSPAIKKKIDSFMVTLVKKSSKLGEGLFWDKIENSIKPLCGISHGSSGIGLVFLELGNYFEIKEYYEIAKQAFLYENQFFNSHEKNWPDFRILNEEIYVKDIKSTMRYASAWCHGAPGIGLTRIRANELLDGEFIDDIIAAGKNILLSKNNQRLPHCLCHGILGNYFFFLEMFKRTKKQEYLDLFRKACLAAILEKQRSGFYKTGNPFLNNKDLSLFLGISGIAYAFLLALTPKKTFTYLLPVLDLKYEKR